MIRLATPTDLPAIRSFLKPRAETSLFLSSNLRDHGLNTTNHPKAMTLWIAFCDDAIQAVIGRTQQGILLREALDFDPSWSADLRRAMAGRSIIGLNGEAWQMAALRSALGLDHTPVAFEEIEPLFRLALTDLTVPDGSTHLRNITETDLPLVTDWRLAYDREAFGDDDTPEMRRRTYARAQGIVSGGHGRMLELNGTPVAMTSFNATLDGIVQVGSVYTPPPLRGRGHARRAVALHLAEARATGVNSAILYSLGAAATLAYQSIGFRQIGAYATVDFAQPTRITIPLEAPA